MRQTRLELSHQRLPSGTVEHGQPQRLGLTRATGLIGSVLGMIRIGRGARRDGRCRASLSRATAALAILILASPVRALAEVVCADDLVPPGMAVTATGTAPSCDGSCRAREIKPVCGLIMKICAGQPIPKGYTLDSVTSMPGCQCLGGEEDAYVIRYTGPDGPAALLSTTPSPYSVGSDQRRRVPFGNPLCALNSTQAWPGSGSPWGMPGANQGQPPSSFQSYPGPPAWNPNPNNPPPYAGMAPPGSAGQPVSPWNNQTDEEPFRIGQ